MNLYEGERISNIGDADVDRFHADGFLVLDNIFDKDFIDTLYQSCMKWYRTIFSLISDSKPIGIGVKQGYKEIVQRHLNRFEIALNEDDNLSGVDTKRILLNPLISSLPTRIFDTEEHHIVNMSVIVSLPGAQDQSWHVDGPHLSVNSYLPCHCFNVFIPLIDILPEHGPTEFRPGSQLLTIDTKRYFIPALLGKKLRPISRPTLTKGSVLLFDYRVLHRGTKNTSNVERPFLVITFAKKHFSDVLNYPRNSLFQTARGREE